MVLFLMIIDICVEDLEVVVGYDIDVMVYVYEWYINYLIGILFYFVKKKDFRVKVDIFSFFFL